MVNDSKKQDKKLERQEKKKRLKQEQLINTAETMFIKHGYDNTTLEMIADEVGYTKRTLYFYFKDKDDIFSAVVLNSLTTLQDLLTESVEDRERGIDKLLAMGEAYYRYFNEYPKYFEFNRIFEARLYYYHRPADEPEIGHFAAECQKVNDEITDLLRDAIEKGISDGSVTSQTSSMNMVLILWGSTFGMLQILRMRQKHLDDVYNTTGDELFTDYMTFLRKILEVS